MLAETHRARSVRAVTLLATTLVIVAGTSPAAQARRGPAPTWHRNAGEAANAVATDKDGNAYVVGSVRPGPQRWAMMLRKYRPNGTVIWARRWLPPKGSYVNGRDVAVAPDGGVYVVGGVSPRGCEGSGWFIARYAPDGQRVWLHDEGGWEGCTFADTYVSVAVSGGRLIVAGDRYGCCGSPFNHGYLRSYSTGGRPLWKIPFDAPGIDPSFYDGAEGVAAGSGAFFATGWAATALQEDESDFVDQDVVVQRITTSGRVVWSYTPNDHGTHDVDRGTAISVRGDRLQVTADVDAHVYVRSKAWLGAFSPGGRALWSKAWGATKHGNKSTTAGVSIASTGASYVVGSRRDTTDGGWDLVVRMFGPGGALMWETLLERGIQTLLGTDAAASGGSAFVTGTDADGGGHLWRFGN